MDMAIDVKSAVSRAKAFVQDLFAEEGLSNLGLEEIERDDPAGVWRVTVGFSRPWNTVKDALSALSGTAVQKRAYRVVLIKDSGEVVSVKRRDVTSD